ncbi:hypothetical protein VMCG_05219 [Cytospora schulzeri]|uniref:CHAT domain-containing protein n=1 Tax=Cytospora schulzeri TaxID=448051 RepID=A0A423WQN0_9PEZI|nr:hypothetical protein VMCG_05219 [Valsa malicola]
MANVSTENRASSNAQTAMLLARMAQESLRSCIEGCDISRLDETIDMLELASDMALSNNCIGLPHVLLTDALLCRYQHKPNKPDIDRCIILGELTLRVLTDFKVRANTTALYDMRYKDFGDDADLDKTIEIASASIRNQKSHDSPIQRYHFHQHCGNRLMQRFRTSGDRDDLDASIRTFEQAVREAPPEILANTTIMASLGLGLAQRFIRTRTIDTINRAIVVTEESLRLAAAGDRERPLKRCVLAICLAQRAWVTQHIQHIDDAIHSIETFRKELSLQVLGKSLGYMFAARYAITGSSSDFHCATQEFVGTREFSLLGDLEQKLEDRYIRLGGKPDLDRRIEILITKSAALSHFEKGPESGNKLDGHTRFLSRAIELGKRLLAAMPIEHPSRFELELRLANWLVSRSKYTGESSDIDEAGLLVSPFGSERRGYNIDEVIAYAKIVNARFKMNGDTTGIDSTIYALQEIARTVGPSASLATVSLADKASGSVSWIGDLGTPSVEKGISILAPLARLQNCRHLAFGNIADVNAAIENMESAIVRQVPNTNTRDTDFSMHFELSVFIMTRYNWHHASKDFKDAMYWCNKVLDLAAEEDPSRSDMLGLRSNLLSERFNGNKKISDLNMAISDARLASATAQGRQQRASHLVSLGVYLRKRYSTQKDASDLEETIRITREALSLLNGFQSGMSRHLGLLGLRQLSGALLQRAKVSDSCQGMQDMDDSINAIEEAARHLKMDDPMAVGLYCDMGFAYLARLEVRDPAICKETDEATSQDRVSAVDAFSKCVKSSSPGAPMQIDAALKAVPLLRSLGRGKESVELLKQAFRKLSPVAPRYLPRGDQESNLAWDKQGRAAEAAAIFIEEGADPQEALALLDSGRGILANRAMQVRADTSILDASTAARFKKLLERLSFNDETNSLSRYPDFDESKIKRVKEEYEAREGRRFPITLLPRDQNWVIKSDLYERFQAEKDFEELLIKIRSDPKTRNFLGPPDIEQVIKTLGDDTLVAINDSAPYHTFIIDRRAGLRVITLDKLQSEDVRTWTADLKRHRPSLDPTMLQWLWTSIADPVLQEIQPEQCHVPRGHSLHLPRVIWMPIGNLSHFPFHAAGFHGKPSRTVMDRVISSYTSSLTAFVLGRSKAVPKFEGSAPGQAVLIGMDTTACVKPNDTAKFTPLPFAKEEVRRVEQTCSSFGLEAVRMANANRGEALINIDRCTIFHFAGHGLSSPENPSSGGLAMADKILTVSLLQEDRYINLLRADTLLNQGTQFLAYLSACLTGSHDTPQLLDEGINIISGFQLAGFRHVIGTTWQVSDKYCVEVAELFYKSLAKRGLVDSAVSLALHDALVTGRDAWLRDESKQAVTYTREAPGEETEGTEGGDQDHEAGGEGREMTLERKNKVYERKLVRAWWVPYVHFGP